MSGELADLSCRDLRSDDLCGVDVVVEPGEPVGNPRRDRCAAAFGEPGDGRERMDREDAGHDRDVDPMGLHPIAVAQVLAVVEEHLRHRRVGAGSDLLGEHVEVVIVGRRLRVTLGIGRDRNTEVASLLDGADEIGSALVALGVRL